jgi:glycosyltransferase involved in cell wall biosynthesis
MACQPLIMPPPTDNVEARLTIAIPTYNRAANLQAQLGRLAPQLTPAVRCAVHDNASPDATAQVVRAYASHGIAHIRNPANIGAERNFLRCFEECQTEWLWILSDDDPILPNAVAELLALLRDCPGDFIHTSTHLCRYETPILISEAGRLLEHATLAALTFISAGVYRTSSCRPWLEVFERSMATGGAQAVMVLAMLEAHQGRALLSPARLVPEPPGTARWSTLDFIVHYYRLPDYLTQPALRQSVAERVWLECVDWALLVGLRETNSAEQVLKWQRTRKTVRQGLKRYGARSPSAWAVRNWHRSGQRKQSLTVLHQALVLLPLGGCPPALFHRLLRILPLPRWVRAGLPGRNEQAVARDWAPS